MKQPHRFDHLARRLTAPFWKLVRSAVSTIQSWPSDGKPLGKIRDALSGAEVLARDALRVIADALFVFPSSTKPRRDRCKQSATTSTGIRTPCFRLCIAPKEAGPDDETGAPTEGLQNEKTPPPDPAEALTRRMTALEDALANPGRYAVSIWHDDNGSGEFDMGGPYGMPANGWAMHNSSALRGPPTFEAISLDVSATGATVREQMIYGR